MFHRRNKIRENPKKLSFKCLHQDCNKTFGSQPSLSRHQRKENHTARSSRKEAKRSNKRKVNSNTTKTNSKTKKRRTIKEVLRTTVSESESSHEGDSSGEEEEKCSSENCRIESSSEEESKWLQCEGCDKWFHAFCVGMEEMSKDALEELEFKCDDCK